MYGFKYNLFRGVRRRAAFTIVEVVAALAVLSIMLTSVMVLINRYVESVMDMQLREEAFEIARSNMETLLTETRLSDMAEYGTSELNPAIEWETMVEPFYEPITNRMWIRAVCSAGFKDTQGQYQDVELEHWITNLTAAQIKQILAQQELEEEFLRLLKSGELTDLEKTTLAFLKEYGLDHKAYWDFREQQRKQKLRYISEYGMEGWEEFLEELEEEEYEFLTGKLGVDIDVYNEFAARFDPSQYQSGLGNSSGTPDALDTDQDSPLDVLPDGGLPDEDL